jgi:UDP-N-acetylmuramoyl-tripeptide--D-alanyl-D-alanine ligase
MPASEDAAAILGGQRRARAGRRLQCERGFDIAALETLCDLPLQGRRVAILGDMGELGTHSEAAHAEVGRRAGELGIGQLFTVGKMSVNTARAARDAGLARVIEFADVEAAMRAVKNFLKPGDVVLLKASRASRLERIAETLKSEKS